MREGVWLSHTANEEVGAEPKGTLASPIHSLVAILQLFLGLACIEL